MSVTVIKGVRINSLFRKSGETIGRWKSRLHANVRRVARAKAHKTGQPVNAMIKTYYHCYRRVLQAAGHSPPWNDKIFDAITADTLTMMSRKVKVSSLKIPGQIKGRPGNGFGADFVETLRIAATGKPKRARAVRKAAPAPAPKSTAARRKLKTNVAKLVKRRAAEAKAAKAALAKARQVAKKAAADLAEAARLSQVDAEYQKGVADLEAERVKKKARRARKAKKAAARSKPKKARSGGTKKPKKRATTTRIGKPKRAAPTTPAKRTGQISLPRILGVRGPARLTSDVGRFKT